MKKSSFEPRGAHGLMMHYFGMEGSEKAGDSLDSIDSAWNLLADVQVDDVVLEMDGSHGPGGKFLIAALSDPTRGLYAFEEKHVMRRNRAVFCERFGCGGIEQGLYLPLSSCRKIFKDKLENDISAHIVAMRAELFYDCGMPFAATQGPKTDGPHLYLVLALAVRWHPELAAAMLNSFLALEDNLDSGASVVLLGIMRDISVTRLPELDIACRPSRLCPALAAGNTRAHSALECQKDCCDVPLDTFHEKYRSSYFHRRLRHAGSSVDASIAKEFLRAALSAEVCVVCAETAATEEFPGCGHVSACYYCAARVAGCPTCTIQDEVNGKARSSANIRRKKRRIRRSKGRKKSR